MPNIHVSLAWMPVKALLAHGSAISAGTSRILGSMEETRLMQQRRGIPKGARRLTPFGCRRHPDAKQVCLMFDKEKRIQNSLEFEKVAYKNIPPEVDFFDQYKKSKNNEDMDLGKFLLTKHTGWAYEKEFRSVSFKIDKNSSKLGFSIQLKNNSLKGIVMGSKVSQVDKSLLVTLSEEFGFELYIATANNENYNIDIKGINKKPAR